jgi:acetyl esterase/lipase
MNMILKINMSKIFILAISLLSITIMAEAQITTISLWHDSIPEEKKTSEYKESTENWGDVLGIVKVTNPTITVYFPENMKTNSTAVVICPGGGYAGLAIDFEGTEIAKWLNSIGVVGIILKYRLPSDIIMKNKSIGPLQDVQEAIRVVRRNSIGWKIDSSKIGVMGFSAGGHLASTASTQYNYKIYNSDSTSARPDFSLLIYPVISMRKDITHMGSRENLLGKNPNEKMIVQFSNEEQVTPDTPPAFLVHATNDNAVPVQNSICYLLALKKNNVACELHIYETGGHGFSIAHAKNTEASWPKACEIWLKAHGFL